MNLKQALQRIEELERKVRELEAAPKQEYHYHYHTPAYQPQPLTTPNWPYIPQGPTWTCGNGAAS